MNTPIDRAEALIAMSNRIADTIEADIAVLRTRRPAQLARTEADRELVMLQYSRAVADFRNAGTAKLLPADVKNRLNAATRRVMSATREQNLLLTRFRHVTEGLIRSVANVVIARETPTVYSKSGAMARTSAYGRGAAMTFSQAV